MTDDRDLTEDEWAEYVSDMERAAMDALRPVLDPLPPLDRAAALIEIGEYLRFAGNDAVRDARAAGATWQQVADSFGITRQSAHERWGQR